MKRVVLVVLTFIVVSLFFFYPIFKGDIPFPGDLLVGNYAPYSSNSYFGYQAGGVPNKAQGPDVMRQLFPWKNFVIESFKDGQIPFWNPYNLSGNPLMANFQSGTFYPLNVVFLLNFLTGWTFFVLLIPILAGFFTYLFLRELNVSRIASIFGGMVFAFSSYMVVWMEYGNVGHTFVWMPLVLLFTEKLIKNFSKKNIILLIISLMLSLLAGYIQGYFYIVLASIFYFFIKSICLKNTSLKKELIFLIIIVCPLFLTSFQIIPTLELFFLSSRNNYTLFEIDKLLNPIWYTITVIIPNFFGNPATRNSWFYGTYIERVSYFGLIPFVFAIFGALNFKKNKEILIFSIIALFSLIMSTNLFFNKFLYLFPLPVISTTVPTRILSLFVFSGGILAAFGLDRFIKKDPGLNKLLKIVIIFFALMWIVLLWITEFSKNSVMVSNFIIARNNLILPTALLMCFVVLIICNNFFRQKKIVLNFVILAIFTLTLFDLFYFFQRITPFAPKEYVYPQTSVFEYLKRNAFIYRVWGYGSAAIENNFQTYEKIFSTDGYEPLHIKAYGELISTSRNGDIDFRVAGSDAGIASGYGPSDLKINLYRQRILNLLGVKYVLNKNEFLGKNYNPDYDVFPKERYRLVWQNAPWQIYENKEVLPRFFLASDYLVEKDVKKIIQMIANGKLDLKNKIILDQNIDPNLNLSNDRDAKVELKKYVPNKVVLQTSSKSNMLLFLSDNYYPGWKVSIDGEFAKIYRADYSFRAVLVLSGVHEIEFAYNPGSFRIGLWISVVTFLVLSAGLIILKKNENIK